MFSDENDNDTQPSSGPKPMKTRKLRWERSKMRNIKAKLDATGALQHMFSDENDSDTQPSSGPKPMKTRKLRWERSKMRNIKAKLDATYLNRLTEKQ